MRDRRFLLCFVVTALVIGVSTSSVAAASVPDRIRLPDGSQPEGLAISNDGTFYTGSLADGTIYVGDVESGRVRVLVPGAPGRSALGVEVRGSYVWVAGGATGRAWVFRRDGQLVRTYVFEPGGFVNDVVVTHRAAYFTDSFSPSLHRVPIADDGRPMGQANVETRALTGDITYEEGFNANGIDVVRGTGTMVMVQSNTGELFGVRPSGRTSAIDLGGARMSMGDGVVVRDHIVYDVQNFQTKVAKERLSDDLGRGRVVSRTTHPALGVPTSGDLYGGSLLLVNARFTTPPAPDTRYWITSIPRP